MDEIAVTFAPPHVRAAATHVGPPLDRISVRDYVRSADVGAFRSEQGLPQRIRFNVVLEVSNHAAAASDDVDQVVSYDTITDAIEAAIRSERADLLETLAERVARGCLSDPRAVRVFVRLEKLDRIPGALGVEIVRNRLPDNAARLHSVEAEPVERPARRPLVVYLSSEAQATADLAAWRKALAALDLPAVVCAAPAQPQPPAGSAAELQIGLLAIEQAAWALAGAEPGFEVVASRTELEHAFAVRGRIPVWAPARMVAAAPETAPPDAADPAALAAWLAARLDAAALVLIGDAGGLPETAGRPVHRLDAGAPHRLPEIAGRLAHG